MSLFQMQREQIKHNILDTSVTIFKEKGYENTTIAEITKSVGIAKGTFYHFYQSKSDILLAWAAKKFSTFQFQELLSPDNSLEKNLEVLFDFILKAIDDDEELFRVFIREIMKVHNDKNHSESFDFITIYRNIMINSKEAGIKADSQLDIKIEVLNNSIFMGIGHWFDSGKAVPGLKEYVSDIIRVCLYGILEDRKGE